MVKTVQEELADTVGVPRPRKIAAYKEANKRIAKSKESIIQQLNKQFSMTNDELFVSQNIPSQMPTKVEVNSEIHQQYKKAIKLESLFNANETQHIQDQEIAAITNKYIKTKEQQNLKKTSRQASPAISKTAFKNTQQSGGGAVHFSKRSRSTAVDFNKTQTAATMTADEQKKNAWLTQGRESFSVMMAPDQTQRSVPRRQLDLESNVDLASLQPPGDEQQQQDEEKEEQQQNRFTDPILTYAEYDYRTRTHVDQYKTMENMMKHKRRLINDNELPPIAFSLNKRAMVNQDEEHLDRQVPFFKSYFDKDNSHPPEPDLEKRLIVQKKKLEQGDLDGYEKAKVLKEHRVTLQQLQGDEYESSDDNYLSDESLNEFWKVEGVELTREKQQHKERMKMFSKYGSDKMVTLY